MPWEGVTVSEQRQNFIRDYRLNGYSVSELSERFSITLDQRLGGRSVNHAVYSRSCVSYRLNIS